MLTSTRKLRRGRPSKPVDPKDHERMCALKAKGLGAPKIATAVPGYHVSHVSRLLKKCPQILDSVAGLDTVVNVLAPSSKFVIPKPTIKTAATSRPKSVRVRRTLKPPIIKADPPPPPEHNVTATPSSDNSNHKQSAPPLPSVPLQTPLIAFDADVDDEDEEDFDDDDSDEYDNLYNPNGSYNTNLSETPQSTFSMLPLGAKIANIPNVMLRMWEDSIVTRELMKFNDALSKSYRPLIPQSTTAVSTEPPKTETLNHMNERELIIQKAKDYLASIRVNNEKEETFARDDTAHEKTGETNNVSLEKKSDISATGSESELTPNHEDVKTTVLEDKTLAPQTQTIPLEQDGAEGSKESGIEPQPTHPDPEPDCACVTNFSEINDQPRSDLKLEENPTNTIQATESHVEIITKKPISGDANLVKVESKNFGNSPSDNAVVSPDPEVKESSDRNTNDQPKGLSIPCAVIAKEQASISSESHDKTPDVLQETTQLNRGSVPELNDQPTDGTTTSAKDEASASSDKNTTNISKESNDEASSPPTICNDKLLLGCFRPIGGTPARETSANNQIPSKASKETAVIVESTQKPEVHVHTTETCKIVKPINDPSPSSNEVTSEEKDQNVESANATKFSSTQPSDQEENSSLSTPNSGTDQCICQTDPQGAYTSELHADSSGEDVETTLVKIVVLGGIAYVLYYTVIKPVVIPKAREYFSKPVITIAPTSQTIATPTLYTINTDSFNEVITTSTPEAEPALYSIKPAKRKVLF